MELKNHYNRLWEQSIQKFKKGEFEFDSLIDSNEDTRYGITLLARPSTEVKHKISATLDEIKAVAPNQYCYPASDLHITILSIVSCNAGFTLDEIDQTGYQKIVQSVIRSISPFKIRFCGITASPSCILVQGFPDSNQLVRLRNGLREKFKRSNLHHSVDKRYQLQTAHLTVVRFRESFRYADRFIDKIAGSRDRYFGGCIIEEVELVGNDWYQRQGKVKLIAKFSLNE